MEPIQHEQLEFFKKNKIALKAKHIAVLAATVFSYFGMTYYLGVLENNSKRVLEVTHLGIDCESIVTEYSLKRLNKGSHLSKERLHEWGQEHAMFMENMKEAKTSTDTDLIKKAYQNMHIGHKKLFALFDSANPVMDDKVDLDSIIQWEAKYLIGVNTLVANYQKEKESIMVHFKLFVIVLALLFLILIYFSYVVIVHPMQARFKKSLEEIIDQKTRLRALVDSTEELIWSVDINGRLLMFNKAFEAFFKDQYNKYPELDMDTNGIDYFKSQQTAYNHTLKRNAVTISHDRIGEKIYESRFNPVVRNGEVTGCIVRRSDVTERERVVDEIKKGREDLIEAQEIANMGSWNWDIVNDLMDWSDHLYIIFGQKKFNFIPRHETVKKLIHSEDRRPFDYSIKRILKKRGKNNFDMVYRIMVNKQIRFVHQQGRIFRNKNGHPIRMAGTIQDVTEKVLSDQKIEKQNNELRHFINVISHNLRRPLSNLLALTHLYEPGHHKENDFVLDHIQISGEELDNTIKDLNLSLSLKEVDTTSFMDIELDRIIDEATILLQKEIHDSGAELKLNSNCKHVKGIKRYYVNIFYHLLSNAITYTKPGKVPKIKVSVIEHPDNITIKVRDNGKGFKLTPENRKKIFNMYGRLSGKTTGKGLGLYIVKNQVEAMNGEIDVQSRPNKGTIFEIKIWKLPNADNTEKEVIQISVPERSKFRDHHLT